MIELTKAHSVKALNRTVSVPDLAATMHHWMHPYADSSTDIHKGLLDALHGRPAPGGFVLCAVEDGVLTGVLVMLRTGMSGYIPPNLLLFLAVDPLQRRRGIGYRLVERALAESCGAVKLHVEVENPAKNLYKKLGFIPAYLDMRLQRSE